MKKALSIILLLTAMFLGLASCEGSYIDPGALGTGGGKDWNPGSGGGRNPSGTGTEADPFPLTAGVWTNGSISSSSGSVWYSFNGVSGTAYYVWLDDADNTSGMMDAKVAAYYSNGNNIFDADANTRSFTAGSTGTIKIKVYPYSGGAGTFALAYSTSSTRP